jgi:hypothetical protein
VLADITDNPYYSICARCGLTNIFETALTCPNCQHDLGPATKPLTIGLAEVPPLKKPEDHASSFITFECAFSGQLGCRIQGDGPTLVTLIIDPEIVLKIQEGKIIESVGDEAHITALTQHGFRPRIGDVLVAIEDINVSHLNSVEVHRYIKRQKNKVKRTIQRAFSDRGMGTASETMSVSSSRTSVERKIKVSFRRHFVDNVEDIVKHDEKVAQYLQEKTSKGSTLDESKVHQLIS